MNDAGVAELADAPDLGSGGEIRRGSSPLPGTAQSAPTTRWFIHKMRLLPTREAMYNPGCCGRTFLREGVQGFRLCGTCNTHIGTNFCTRTDRKSVV